MGRLLASVGVAGLFLACPFVRCADKTALTQRLRNVAENSSIDDPALKPWHLKVSFQLLNEKGATREEGTIEEWWSPEKDKRVYSSPSYTAAEIRHEKEVQRTKYRGSAPYLLQLLRDEIVHPVNAGAELDDSIPELHVESFGKVKFDCIMASPAGKDAAHSPLGVFPTYCLSQDTARLRDSLRNRTENVARNTIGTFQGRAVPIDLAVSEQAGTVAKSHVAALVISPLDEHLFDPDDTMVAQDPDPVKVDLKEVTKWKLSGAVPVFPGADKSSRTSGAVHIHVVIGTDGHIHQLSLIDAPSQTLAASALDAVRTWVYKPYLVNGVPYSVDTVVTVNYSFGN